MSPFFCMWLALEAVRAAKDARLGTGGGEPGPDYQGLALENQWSVIRSQDYPCFSCALASRVPVNWADSPQGRKDN